MLKANIAVFVSGGGTNLQALIDAQKSGIIQSGEIKVVVSSQKDAYALTRAANAGIPGVAVVKKECGSQEAYEEALMQVLGEYDIDMIVLAGYLSILSGNFTNKWPNRIINVHPALIPSFCGKGYYGLRVHEEALKKGVKVSGATVHFVTAECDAGPIILQKSVEVMDDDTPETLQKRIMEQVEWKILPKAVQLFCDDKIVIENGKTYIK